MDRSQALALMHKYVENENLRRHMYAVEAAMVDYAERLGHDPEAWGLAGLLHDFDWEIHPTLEQHPQDGAPILREQGVPEAIVRCILSHADHAGVQRESDMERGLYACDEITGLIVAVALVRPDKKLASVQVRSVKKKWKDRRFAAGVEREQVELAAAEFGVELWQHVANVLASMQRVAPQLGLA